MKNLVIGASGQIGQALMTSLKNFEAIGTYCDHEAGTQLDITDPKAVHKLLLDVRPEVIFVPAAFTNVDACEVDGRAFEINVNGIKNIVDSIHSIKDYHHKQPLVVCFSSDYVFDGKAGPYDEHNIVNPINTYGKQKVLAEHMLATTYSNFIIIRTTGVFGPDIRNKNFVIRLVQNLKAGKTAQIPEDEIGTPTYSPNLSEALLGVIENVGLFYRSRSTHIINISGSGVCSRYEFAQEICKVFGCDSNLLRPVRSRAIHRLANRPLLAGLKTEKISGIINKNMLHYSEALEKYRNKLGL